MITAQDFCRSLARRGFEFCAGVPCSHLSGPIAVLSERPGAYVAAANEGAALATAAGAVLGGRRSFVMLQNSGLGNLINPLTSLLLPYRIPVLIFVSMRGWPAGGTDEPQHAVMGDATSGLLDAIGVSHRTLGPAIESLEQGLDEVGERLGGGFPAVLLVPRDSIEGVEAESQSQSLWSCSAALLALVPHLDGRLVVSTTGYISRRLHSAADRAANFYMQGSMGHALALGLGVAKATPSRPVIVLDGDGALLMHLGSASTVAAEAPPNLLHVVLDNGCYESTGGQPTTSRVIDWVALGRGVGYRSTEVCASAAALDGAMSRCGGTQHGPCLLVIRVAPSAASHPPPRASRSIDLPDLTLRFQNAVRGFVPPRRCATPDASTVAGPIAGEDPNPGQPVVTGDAVTAALGPAVYGGDARS